jgi:hypothetical protein
MIAVCASCPQAQHPVARFSLQQPDGAGSQPLQFVDFQAQAAENFHNSGSRLDFLKRQLRLPVEIPPQLLQPREHGMC